MILAKVLGNVVATQKNYRYDNARVMLCEQITPEGDPGGNTILALDSVDAGVGDTVLIVQEGWGASTAATGKAGAGVGELVFWCRGREASFPFKREDTPTDCTIVAIVDSDDHVCC